ncbi:MAG: 30S ribosomal protein S8 [Candidatus Anstonellales archaeon]
MAKDILAENINKIKIYDMLKKEECVIKYSKLMLGILEQLKKYGYIEDYRYEDNNKGGIIIVKLKGRINDIGVIKPRAPVKRQAWYEKEAQYLPAYNIGHLIVSTPKGILTNIEAKSLGMGGRLLLYVY